MLRNNCYLSKSDKKKWSWVGNREFLEAYWREGVKRGSECFNHVEHVDHVGKILWTIGMRGIHDGKMQVYYVPEASNESEGFWLKTAHLLGFSDYEWK